MINGKRIIFLLVILSGLMGCNRTPKTEFGDPDADKDAPQITFETLEYDFGTIDFKGDAEYDFVFTNNGNEPLVLKNVKPTCGCTASDYTKEPVGKGQSGKISVKYRTSIPGNFTKSIMVYSNAANPVVKLVIKGTVEKPAAAEG